MEIEHHPFEPFLPLNAKLLMLGTFPPAEKRWAMKFYYPNFTNDMWRIMGICFFGDKMHFVRLKEKTYDIDNIVAFLKEKGIAMYDTATRIIRTKNTASDKDLDIVEEDQSGGDGSQNTSVPGNFDSWTVGNHNCLSTVPYGGTSSG